MFSRRTMQATRSLLPLLLAAALAPACGGGDSSGPGNKGQMVKQAGDGQSAAVTTTLQPFQVVVTDLNGAPRAGVTVRWSVASGGGSVTPAQSTTDAGGIASATATLGTLAGVQTVRARATGYAGSPVSFSSAGTADVAASLQKTAGDQQVGPAGTELPIVLSVSARDQYGNPVANAAVTWTAATGSGSVSTPSTLTGTDGGTSVSWTLGTATGSMSVVAALTGVDSVTFTATASANFTIEGGGNNVPERYTSDLWVADGYAYTGTWGVRNAQGNAVKIWQLDPQGAPILADSIIVAGVSTISDVQVSEDGKWLALTTENGTSPGLYVYELTAPGQAVFRASHTAVNLHTGTLATIGGKLYAFTAKDPANCALLIFDLSAAGSGTIAQASSTPIPDHYCIHDTFVRDGYAFVFAWDEGLYIFDVGNGSHGGSPTTPVQISHTGSQADPAFGGQTHNGWWFHNPVTQEQRYLFIGEEGPGLIGESSSGNIHVVDVSDFTHPVEVGFYSMSGAGTHNFWVDEPNQRLYAAYYNGGVVALDISGTLSGNLANREIAHIRPGGSSNTYVWGVMLYNGSIYASDMLSGLWQLGPP